VELHRVRPAQRLQPAVLPGREQLLPDPGAAERGPPAVRPAGQEPHQHVGDPEEGRARATGATRHVTR